MFFAVSSVKELFESVENHIPLLLLSKKHILSSTVMFVISVLY